jgi:phosphoribosylcarboxyaminoimidazole (NCAIR) mutase
MSALPVSSSSITTSVATASSRSGPVIAVPVSHRPLASDSSLLSLLSQLEANAGHIAHTFVQVCML